MKQRFRLYRRSCSGRFYIHDSVTGKQESLGTADRIEAERLLHSKNEADRQPAINLQIARAYLAAGDPDIMTRTWKVVMDELIKAKQGSTRERYVRSFKEHALDSLRSLPILQTRPEHYLHALEVGTVSTNDILRRVHIRPFHDVVALAGVDQEAVARFALRRKTRHYLGGASGD